MAISEYQLSNISSNTNLWVKRSTCINFPNVPSAMVSVPTMGHAVSRLNLTANSKVHSQVGPRGTSVNNVILGRLLPSTSAFLIQYYSTDVPHQFIRTSPTLCKLRDWQRRLIAHLNKHQWPVCLFTANETQFAAYYLCSSTLLFNPSVRLTYLLLDRWTEHLCSIVIKQPTNASRK
jgi:hypothetical protein